MQKRLAYIGAQSSAGAYAPGQELAPQAFRDIGFLEMLRTRGIVVHDLGDIEKFRWRPDPKNMSAMNVEAVIKASQQTAQKVASAYKQGMPSLVIGGDCTLQFGSVSGLLAATDSVGLIYCDLDPDMQTPFSTWEGALDYMGVAHMLDLAGCVQEFSHSGPRTPLLSPSALRLFMIDNATPQEEGHIGAMGIAVDHMADVLPDPYTAGIRAAEWAAQFKSLAIHIDIDVLNFGLMPIAENTRKKGTTLSVLTNALRGLFTATNLSTVTLTEINPLHGAEDGSTIRKLAEPLTELLSEAACLQ